MLKRSHIIHERSNIIPIKQNLSTYMKVNSPKGEYSLKQNFFDPFKSSPPNEFMLKLHMRMSVYNSNIHTDIKDDSRDNE
jgi:hypothetical protein